MLNNKNFELLLFFLIKKDIYHGFNYFYFKLKYIIRLKFWKDFYNDSYKEKFYNVDYV